MSESKSYDFSWQNNFSSKRADGRHVSTLAASMARLREIKPALEFSFDFDGETFRQWQSEVKQKLYELMCFEPFTNQPEPVMQSEVMRDGYRIQRWEFFPDKWSVVPVLILIPDGVSEDNPVPGVLCFPGSATSKELLAGEPLLEHPNCHQVKHPERNCMALHYVKAGMIAVAFDNPGTAELAEMSPVGLATQGATRVKLSGELLNLRQHYLGLSVQQKICFMRWFKNFPGLDAGKIAVSGHSLGSEPAMVLGILDDDISAIVFNDFVCDARIREAATTNIQLGEVSDGGNWHHVPALWKYFGFPDLLAALAPRPLALNEGGAPEFIAKIEAAYKLLNADNNLSFSNYPKFSSEDTDGNLKKEVPRQDLSNSDFYKISRVDVADHSFRQEISLNFLKKHFEL